MNRIILLLLLCQVVWLSSCKPKQIKSSEPTKPSKEAQAFGSKCEELAQLTKIPALKPTLTDGSGLSFESLRAGDQTIGGSFSSPELNLAPGSQSDYVLWKVCTLKGSKECFPADGSWEKSVFSKERMILPFDGPVILYASACTEHPVDPDKPCGPVSEYRFFAKNSDPQDALSSQIKNEFNIQLSLNAQLKVAVKKLLDSNNFFVDTVSPYMDKSDSPMPIDLQNAFQIAENIKTLSFSKLLLFVSEILLPWYNEQQPDQGSNASANLAAGTGSDECSIDKLLSGSGFSSKNDVGKQLPTGSSDQDYGGINQILSANTPTPDMIESDDKGTEETKKTDVVSDSGTGGVDEYNNTVVTNENMVDRREKEETKDDEEKEKNNDRTRYMLMGFGGLIYLTAGAKFWDKNQDFFRMVNKKRNISTLLDDINKLEPGKHAEISKKLTELAEEVRSARTFINADKSVYLRDIEPRHIDYMAALSAKGSDDIGNIKKAVNIYQSGVAEGASGSVKFNSADELAGIKGNNGLDFKKADLGHKGISVGSPIMIAVLATVVFTMGALDLASTENQYVKLVRHHKDAYMDQIGPVLGRIIDLLNDFNDSEARLEQLSLQANQ